MILYVYNLLLAVGGACSKDGGEGKEDAFFTFAIGCFVKWLFFSILFQNRQRRRISEGI